MHDAEVNDVSANGVVEHCGIELNDKVGGRWFTVYWVKERR